MLSFENSKEVSYSTCDTVSYVAKTTYMCHYRIHQVQAWLTDYDKYLNEWTWQSWIDTTKCIYLDIGEVLKYPDDGLKIASKGS